MIQKNKYQLLAGSEGAKYFDWSTFLIVIMLLGAGLISIYSATKMGSSGGEISSTFIRQLMAAGIGLVSMIVISYMPHRWIQNYSIPVYAISVALLILVLFVGKTVYGTQGWLSLGGFSLQPAEIAKLGTILVIAAHLARRGSDIRTLRDLTIVILLVAIPLALIAKQPDFGSASVLVALLFGVLLWSGFDTFILYFIAALPLIILMSLIGSVPLTVTIIVLSLIAVFFRRKIVLTAVAIAVFIGVGVSSPIIYKSLKPYQQERIATFLNPDKDPRGRGYNVIQSKLAVGSGGLTGKGFMHGTQTQLRYIPKQWTDFIFSVPTEEFGFVGGVSVVALLMGFIWRAIRIATEADDKFSSLVAIGITSIFIYHILINIGMVIGLMPVMGIPLPFMSAGGTALMVNLAMAGVLMNLYRYKRVKR